jgi:RND family efflux transporter MFP subunit
MKMRVDTEGTLAIRWLDEKSRRARRFQNRAYNPPRMGCMSSDRNQMTRTIFATSWKPGIAVCALAVALAAGCRRAPQAQKPPPISVTVSQPISKEIIEWDQYDGHIFSQRTVSVVSQVTGQIIAASFKEGTLVHQGQTLFVIDPVPFKATYDGKKADADKSAAQMQSTKADFDRDADAYKTHAISEQVYDDAKFAYEQAVAQHASDVAAMVLAKNNLDWCNVVAPITGLAGKYEKDIGNVVTAGTPSPVELTTIQSLDPMYCYVDVDEASVQRYQELQQKKQVLLNAQGKIPCYLQLDDETGFPHSGYVDFADNSINIGTGTRTIRGVFANPPLPKLPYGKIIAGNHALLRIAASSLQETLLVPDEAIGTNQDVKYVLVALPGGKAVPKPVQLGALFGPLRAIVSGLEPDDEVIIDGQARVIPGVTPVAPTEAPIQYDPKLFALPADLPTTRPTTEPAKAPATTEEPGK